MTGNVLVGSTLFCYLREKKVAAASKIRISGVNIKEKLR
jgi:hypothetical protein